MHNLTSFPSTHSFLKQCPLNLQSLLPQTLYKLRSGIKKRWRGSRVVGLLCRRLGLHPALRILTLLFAMEGWSEEQLIYSAAASLYSLFKKPAQLRLPKEMLCYSLLQEENHLEDIHFKRRGRTKMSPALQPSTATPTWLIQGNAWETFWFCCLHSWGGITSQAQNLKEVHK